jgi:hypothetical protein
METRLVIFLTFVSVTMIVNALFLFLTYKAFSALASKAADRMSEFETNAKTLKWLATLEFNSAEAARVTGMVRDRMAGFSESMEGIEADYGKSLSKAEAGFSLLFRGIRITAAAMDTVVKFPVKNILLMSSVAGRLIAFIRGSENGADARSRQNR